MTPKQLTRIEEFAALAHQQWCGWMDYLFTKGKRGPDGSFTIEPHYVARWARQAATPYAELPHGEQDSDRIEAAKMLALAEKAPDIGERIDALARGELPHCAHEEAASVAERGCAALRLELEAARAERDEATERAVAEFMAGAGDGLLARFASNKRLPDRIGDALADRDERMCVEAVEKFKAEDGTFPACHICNKPATCFGSYERNDAYGFACSDCCGHGCEDGWCTDDFSEIGEHFNEMIRSEDASHDLATKAQARIEALTAALVVATVEIEALATNSPRLARLRDELRAALSADAGDGVKPVEPSDPWRIAQQRQWDGTRLDAYNVVRFKSGEPRGPNGHGPFEHYEDGGFTKATAEAIVARLNAAPTGSAKCATCGGSDLAWDNALAVAGRCPDCGGK